MVKHYIFQALQLGIVVYVSFAVCIVNVVCLTQNHYGNQSCHVACFNYGAFRGFQQLGIFGTFHSVSVPLEVYHVWCHSVEHVQCGLQYGKLQFLGLHPTFAVKQAAYALGMCAHVARYGKVKPRIAQAI